jgi:type II secretory pathway pseudopilin PulG
MQPSPRQAFTLLEAIIAVSILAMVLYVAGQGMTSGTGLSQHMTSAMQADQLAKRVMSDIVLDLRSANPTNISLTATSITVKICTDLVAGVPVYGSTHQYIYDAAAGTLTKGVVDVSPAYQGTQVIMRGLPAGAFTVSGDSVSDKYEIRLKTQYTDPSGIVHIVSTDGRAFLRSGLISDSSSSGGITISGLRSNPQGTNTDLTGTITMQPPEAGVTLSGTPTVYVVDSNGNTMSPTLTTTVAGGRTTVGYSLAGVPGAGRTYTVTATIGSSTGTLVKSATF